MGSVTHRNTMQLAILIILPALAAAVPTPNTCRLVDVIPFFNFGENGRSSMDSEDLTVLTEFARFMNHKVLLMLEEFAHLKNILNVARFDNIEEGQDLTAANLRMPKHLQYENEIRSIFDMADQFTKKQQSKFFFPKAEETMEEELSTEAPMEEEPMEEEPESNNIKESIKNFVQKVVDSMKDVVDTIKSKPLSVSSIKSIFAGIIDGVKKTLNDAGITLQDPQPEEEETPAPEASVDSELSYFAKWPLICKALWYPYDSEKCRSARCMACAPAMMASAQVCKRSEGVVSQRCLAVTLGKGFCNFCIGDSSETDY